MTDISKIPLGTLCKLKCHKYLHVQVNKKALWPVIFSYVDNRKYNSKSNSVQELASHFFVENRVDAFGRKYRIITFISSKNYMKYETFMSNNSSSYLTAAEKIEGKSFEKDETVLLVKKHTDAFVKICLKGEFYDVELNEDHWELEKIESGIRT